MTEIGIPSKKMLELEKYIADKYERRKGKGECEITYKELKEECDIDVRTSEGRGKFYTACRRLGLEYVNKPNYGYIMSTVGNAPVIVNNKLDRMKSATVRTGTAIENILEKHCDELPEPQKQSYEHTKLGCAAILGQQRSLKRVVRKELVQLSEVTPIV